MQYDQSSGGYPPPYPGYAAYPTGQAYPPPPPGQGYPPPPHPSFPAAPPVCYPPIPPPVPATKSFYYIRSRLNRLVLNVEGDNRSPGARVIMWSQKAGNCDNQLWYDDLATGTIRSKLNDFCIDFDGYAIILRPYRPGNPNQQWERADPFIRNRLTPNKVLDIANNDSSDGAYLVMWERSGNPNQCFDTHFVDTAHHHHHHHHHCDPHPQPGPPPVAPQPQTRRYFYIVSDMHKKALDIAGGSEKPGAKVIVWPRKSAEESHIDIIGIKVTLNDARNQLWYFDANGVIRSALNDFALTAKNNGDQAMTMPYSGQPSQQWRLYENRIMKNDRECLAISAADRKDGAAVLTQSYKGSTNQHWHIEYV